MGRDEAQSKHSQMDKSLISNRFDELLIQGENVLQTLQKEYKTETLPSRHNDAQAFIASTAHLIDFGCTGGEPLSRSD